jgi:hypothetical protein
MWQLSFPLDEEAAKNVSRRGAEALKHEAIRLCGEWHDPIPQLLSCTPANLVSGYPVYDRDILTGELLSSERVTLLGDAAHPMSPFKVCVLSLASQTEPCHFILICAMRTLRAKERIKPFWIVCC